MFITKPCEQCGEEMIGAKWRRFCNPCAQVRARAAGRCNSSTYQQLARSYVSAAIKRGDLPSLTTNVVDCADCGARAEQYDHRDYFQPMKVDPVCRSCNMRRGPGANDAKPKRKRAA